MFCAVAQIRRCSAKDETLNSVSRMCSHVFKAKTFLYLCMKKSQSFSCVQRDEHLHQELLVLYFQRQCKPVDDTAAQRNSRRIQSYAQNCSVNWTLWDQSSDLTDFKNLLVLGCAKYIDIWQRNSQILWINKAVWWSAVVQLYSTSPHSPSQDLQQLGNSVEVLRFIYEPRTAAKTLTTEIVKHVTTVQKRSILIRTID